MVMENQFPEPEKSGIKKQLWILAAVLLVLISLTILLFIRNHILYREAITLQWRDQLHTTTDIAANNIENFINKYSENLIVAARDPVIKAKSCNRRFPGYDQDYCPLYNLYRVHANDVDAIILIERSGLIKVRFPDADTGISGHGPFCKNDNSGVLRLSEGKVLINGLFLNKYGQPAITISTPVFNKDSLTGVVRWMITARRISSKFIDSVSIGEHGYLWLLDHENQVMAHRNQSIIGKNLFKIISAKPNKGVNPSEKRLMEESAQFFRQLKNNDEGYGSYIDLNDNLPSLAVFKKIKAGNSRWTIITSIPYKEITGPVFKNAVRNIILGLVVTISLLIPGLLYFRLLKKEIRLETETRYLSKIARSASELQAERQKRLTAVLEGQEREKARISRELHDSLGQELLAVKMKMDEISARHEQSAIPAFREIGQSLGKIIEEAKSISDDLMPLTLGELGMVAAINLMCDQMSVKKNMKIDFVSFGIPAQIDKSIQTHIYRICQEGLSNAIKHSGASEVNIQLTGNRERISLTIEDNGAGFDAGDILLNRGNGLNNIRERAYINSGEVRIDSKPGRGTSISVVIPLAGSEQMKS